MIEELPPPPTPDQFREGWERTARIFEQKCATDPDARWKEILATHMAGVLDPSPETGRRKENAQ